MRKRALLAGPSLAVGLALTQFAASLVKEEERKKKRQRSCAGATFSRNGGRAGEAEERGRAERGVEEVDSEAEGSTNRVDKRKRPVALELDEENGSERLNGASWLESASSLDLEENCWPEAGESFADWNLPADTLVALKMMSSQFPKIPEMACRPFVLRSQLYSSVSDRTTADRELEELKQQQVVRIFKLSTGKDDFGIMLIEDYLQQIESEKKRMEGRRSIEETVVFDWFRTYVVTAHTGASIRHSHLVLLLSQGGKVKDKQISLLINSGLLVRQIADETTYWFGIPNVGSLLKSLSQGREELTSFLARRRYKEIIQAVLEKKKLRTSKFDMRFHIRDLLGSGRVYSISTPVGPLLRLSRD